MAPYFSHKPASGMGLGGMLTWPGKQLPDLLPPAVVCQTHLVTPGGKEVRRGEVTNRLFLGDNLAVMGHLLPELRGAVQLIYVDPPFATGKSFRRRLRRPEASPQSPGRFVELPSYRDRWAGSDFLQMIYERLALMRELLAPEGTIYVHLDWRSVHHVKLIMDELFGADRFLNQIIWLYHGPSPITSAFKRKHDVVLVYTRGHRYYFDADAVRVPYDPVTHATFKSHRAGFGKVPNLARGKVPEDWWYVPVVARLHAERVGFETQKPAALLERIILASSRPGDLVADFFCGSGTTLAVADRLGRRWLGCDASRQAVAVTMARLVGQGASPFAVFEASEPDASWPAAGDNAWASGGAAPRIEVERIGERGRARLLDAAGPSGCLDLEYWCVDPDYDGQVLRPSAWAVAGRRGLASEIWFDPPGGRGVAGWLCLEVSRASGQRWRHAVRWEELPAGRVAAEPLGLLVAGRPVDQG